MPEAHHCRFLYWPPPEQVQVHSQPQPDVVREITGLDSSGSAFASRERPVGASSGRINSPRFPASYPERTTCTYEFLARPPADADANATRQIQIAEQSRRRANQTSAADEAPLVVLLTFEQFQIDAASDKMCAFPLKNVVYVYCTSK